MTRLELHLFSARPDVRCKLTTALGIDGAGLRVIVIALLGQHRLSIPLDFARSWETLSSHVEAAECWKHLDTMLEFLPRAR